MNNCTSEKILDYDLFYLTIKKIIDDLIKMSLSNNRHNKMHRDVDLFLCKYLLDREKTLTNKELSGMYKISASVIHQKIQKYIMIFQSRIEGMGLEYDDFMISKEDFII